MPGREVALETRTQRGFWNNQFRHVVFKLLSHLEKGELVIAENGRTIERFGEKSLIKRDN